MLPVRSVERWCRRQLASAGLAVPAAGGGRLTGWPLQPQVGGGCAAHSNAGSCTSGNRKGAGALCESVSESECSRASTVGWHGCRKLAYRCLKRLSECVRDPLTHPVPISVQDSQPVRCQASRPGHKPRLLPCKVLSPCTGPRWQQVCRD